MRNNHYDYSFRAVRHCAVALWGFFQLELSIFWWQERGLKEMITGGDLKQQNNIKKERVFSKMSSLQLPACAAVTNT